MENDELPPRESFDSDEDYAEARRLGVARVRADEEKARIKKPNEQSSLFKADEFGSTRKFTKQKNSTNRILALHHTIMVGEKDCAAAAGVYRLTDVFVGDDPIGVPAWEIEGAMTAFCQWLKAEEEKLHEGGGELARFAAKAHLRLRILALHHTIMVGKKDRAAAAGVYRLTDVFVGDDSIGVPAWEIEGAMTAFCQWLKEANEALNGGGSELAKCE